MNRSFLAVASVFLVSIISLIGVFTLYLNKKRIEKLSFLLVAFSVGALFGGAFFHLLPEAFTSFSKPLAVSFLVLLGIFFFFVLEKFLRWRHCHVPSSKDHPHPLAVMNLVGDAVHNLIDGLIIGAGFFTSVPLGIALTAAVIFHEIPQEIADFGVLLYAGVKPKKALLFNFLSSLAAFLGAFIALFLGSRVEGFSLALLPIAAGGFIYIAGSDLIPELHKKWASRQFFSQVLPMILGALIMAGLVLLEK